MSFSQLLMYWPGSDLNSLPPGLHASEADSMLACWSALWHPRLLSATRQLPRRWTATKSPPLTDDTLLAIPAPSEANAESDLHQFGVNDAVRRVQGFSSRATWEHAFLDCLEDDWRDWHDEAAADFLALGYCFLQVELLTQKLQYSSTLDRGFFSSKRSQPPMHCWLGIILRSENDW